MNSKDNTIRYEFFSENPFTHFLDLECVVPCSGKSELHLSLSFWRPGRYEPGNFARNIRGFRVENAEGKPLKFLKTDKQTWKIFCAKEDIIKVKYQYHAPELNAGSCYVDESQIYVNPIHCVFRCLENSDFAYEFIVRKKEGFKMACPLPLTEGVYRAENYDELADSPFIYSSRLISHRFSVNEIPIYIHINGTCDPDFISLENDFRLFIEEQFEFWQDVPFSEYHFMFQITPYPFYHGVEHANNTVIAIGPGYDIYNRRLYVDVLGISSHELFHAWNVKKMRPADFLQYDYTKENYSELGFVYEGITTYAGDKILLNCGLYSHQEFLNELSVRLKKHIHNAGRFNYSVLESSFDTWLDGYVPGIPDRKTSIYDEGCLIAFMLDVIIFKHSDGKKGLRHLCRELWTRYGHLKKGYTLEDVKKHAAELGGEEAERLFKDYVEKPADYTEKIKEYLEYIGIVVEMAESADLWEKHIGLKWEKGPAGWKITAVYPESPAWKAGLYIGDELLAFNEHFMNDNPNHWLRHYLYAKNAKILVQKKNHLTTIELNWDLGGGYYMIPVLHLVKVESNERKFLRWALL
jgi:predicted metalloprotease with PDZ domain